MACAGSARLFLVALASIPLAGARIEAPGSEAELMPDEADLSSEPDSEPREGAVFLERSDITTEGFWTTLQNKMSNYDNVALEAVTTCLIFIVFSLLVWTCCYPSDAELIEIISDGDTNDPVDIFTAHHFGCFRTPKICLCAFLCPAVRWADTMSLAGLLRASGAFVVFFFFALINGLAYMPVFYGLFTCLLILYYRHKLRAFLGLPNWTGRTCCADFFYVFFCTCCAISQEARVVRYARHHGVLSKLDDEARGKLDEPAPSRAPASQPPKSAPVTGVVAYESEIPGRFRTGQRAIVGTRAAAPAGAALSVPSTAGRGASPSFATARTTGSPALSAPLPPSLQGGGPPTFSSAGIRTIQGGGSPSITSSYPSLPSGGAPSTRSAPPATITGAPPTRRGGAPPSLASAPPTAHFGSATQSPLPQSRRLGSP